MRRNKRLGFFVGLWVAATAACSAEGPAPLEGDGARSAPRLVSESPEARAVVADLQQRFRVTVEEHRLDEPMGARPQALAPKTIPVIRTGTAASFESGSAGRVQVRMGKAARRGIHKPARVELPVRASDPVRIEDATSGMAIEVALEGARDAELKVADGLAVYEAALESGASIVHRVSVEGTEDFTLFESRPTREELSYRVDVSRAAGLRFLGNGLEFLDEQGTPRLRMAPPYVVDAAGQKHEARVAVSGCAYDTDPRGPWGRAVTAPSAPFCAVRVTWADVTYPAIVDPAWTTSKNLAQARAGHTLSALVNGKILVAGGYEAGLGLSSAELYDPATGTWGATGSLLTIRHGHTATVLSSGKVLVAGGYSIPNYLATAELYDPVAGTWSATTSMFSKRSTHTASLILNGRVLVAGGFIGNGQYLASSEIYEPFAKTWTGFTMSSPRSSHTATVLPNGNVLLVGGNSGMKFQASTDLYDVINESWNPAASMATPRMNQTATLLESGKLLIAGGRSSYVDALSSSEVYDPEANTWSALASMATARYFHEAGVLSNGNILLMGGQGASGFLASAELYDPIANAWSGAASMATPRIQHTVHELKDGSVFVVGGLNGTDSLPSVEVFAQLSKGAVCLEAGECVSGFCVDGVCCDAACNADSCDVCSVARGAPSDGTCTKLPGTCKPVESSSSGSGAGSASGGMSGPGSGSNSSGGGGGGGSEPESFYACAATQSSSSAGSSGLALLGGLLLLSGARRRRPGRTRH